MNRQFLTKLVAIVFLGLGVTAFVTAQETIKEIEGPYEHHPEIESLNSKINEKQNELDQLEESSRQYADRINEARQQSVSLNAQLNLLENQITKLTLDAKATEIMIEKTRLEIESAQFQAEKEQEEIDQHKSRLREYIKLIHKEDQRSLLEMLLLNNSFSEFFNQINYIESIQADLKSSIDRLELLKESAEVHAANLTIKREELTKQQERLELDLERKSEQVDAKENLLFETKHSEAKYRQLLEEAQELQAEVDTSISDIKDEIKRKIENLRSGNTNPNATLISWPVSSGRGITTYFNDPEYPFRYLFEHAAIDIRASQGTAIKAPADGYVARARNNGFGYSYITIIHDNGISTVYGHVSAIYVKQDQFVKAGEVIGLTGGAPGTRGAGPFTTGPHLHFEVRLNGIPVDPLQYLP